VALIDDVKTALRVSTTDSDITAQIQQIIDEAQLDLSRTADISASAFTTHDALIKGAICCYARFVWSEDPNEKALLKQCYDDYKGKLSMSSAYGTYPADEEPDEPEEAGGGDDAED
jgi:hypothetical protein